MRVASTNQALWVNKLQEICLKKELNCGITYKNTPVDISIKIFKLFLCFCDVVAGIHRYGQKLQANTKK